MERNGRRWTSEEDRALIAMWGTCPLSWAAKRLHRSKDGVFRRAEQLGLRLGVQAGFEGINAAAKRLGVSTKTLHCILKAHGVKKVQAMSRPVVGAKPAIVCVDSYSATVAIEAWSKTEIVRVAARRHGIDAEGLRKALIAAGHERPKRGKVWRMDSAIIDEVVASRAQTESLMKASERVGVSRETLKIWLLDAGVRPVHHRNWRVAKSVVDAVMADHVGRKSSRVPRRVRRAQRLGQVANDVTRGSEARC